MAEKTIFEVRVIRVNRSNTARLLAEAESKTGDHYDIKRIDDIYEAVDELGYTRPVVIHDTLIVRAWTAEAAEQFTADLCSKDDFYIILSIEAHEAIIREA